MPSQSTTPVSRTLSKRVMHLIEKLSAKAKRTSKRSSPPVAIENQRVKNIPATRKSSPTVFSSHLPGREANMYTLEKYDSQRSTKVPYRQPAPFPINQNFSQRVIIECEGKYGFDEMFPSPGKTRPMLPKALDWVRKEREAEAKSSLHASARPTTSLRKQVSVPKLAYGFGPGPSPWRSTNSLGRRRDGDGSAEEGLMDINPWGESSDDDSGYDTEEEPNLYFQPPRRTPRTARGPVTKTSPLSTYGMTFG